MSQWYLKAADGVSGPFSWEEMRFLAARAKISGGDAVAQAADGPWMPAAAVPGLVAPASAAPAKAAPLPRPPAPAPAAKETPSEISSSAKDAGQPAASPPALPPPLPGPRDASSRQRAIAARVAVAAVLVVLMLLLLIASRGGGGSGGGDGMAAADGSGDSDGGLGGGTRSPEQASPGPQSGAGDVESQANSSSAVADSSETDDRGGEKPTSELATAATSAESNNAHSETGDQAAGDQEQPPAPRRAAVIMPLDDDEGGLVEDGDGHAAGTGGSAEFFQIQGKGQRFVYVVDCSGSMAGPRFTKACRELQESIHKLRSAQSFYVIFFDQTEYPQFFPKAAKGMSRANAGNKRRIGRWIGSFPMPGGGTEPQGALMLALSLRPDVIYFLTDGEFDPGVADVVRRSNKETVIHTVAFMDQSAEELLKQIAKENRGTYRFVP